MINKNIQIILETCGGLMDNDKLLIISDDKTFEIGNYFYDSAKKITQNVLHIKEKYSSIPGASEPSSQTSNEMFNSTLIISLLTSSIAHTKARHNASKNGARFLSLADYSFELLKRNSIDVDYFASKIMVDKIAELLTVTKKIYLTTEKGTKLNLNIKNRVGNSCPCIVRKAGEMGSPPDIEANVAIVENDTNGVFIVDGSIACSEIGLLDEDVNLDIKNGKIVSFKGKYSDQLEKIFASQSILARVPAELGFGFNKQAKLCGIMLEDEGCYGTVHIGFGSNSTIGGNNNVPFHLDMIIKKPTVYFDDKMILDNGDYII